MLRAATTLFGRQGYTSTTLEQIGAEAGYSSALVSLRFGSKDGIVDAIVTRLQTALGDRVFGTVGVVGLDRLNHIFTGYGETIRIGQRSMRALFVLMAESLGPLQAKVDLFRHGNERFAAAIETAIREGQETGEIRPDLDPVETAFQILASIRGTTLLWLLEPKNVDVVAAIEELRVAVESRLSVRASGS